MTYNFCTLFDKNFLARGLALHASLLEHCPDFTLWMLCMDDKSYEMLEKMRLNNQLKNVRLLRLPEVEDERLLKVKPTRTPVEYYWMFSSSLPLYLLEKNPSLDMIAYLDADLYFYASPDEIYREFGGNSIMIIPHRFSDKEKWREKESGIYNVGMTIFRNDANALECLRWWKDRVIEWCYYRYEDGKLGDQLYLNDWPTRFKGVHVLKNPGANVASWNIEGFLPGGAPLIFYHFHGLKIYRGAGGIIKAYPATIHDQAIYKPYIKALNRAYRTTWSFDPDWTYGLVKRLDIFRLIKQYIGL